jgi:hypothetical protein
MDAFVGIDVACAKRKRLPVCLCVWKDQRLVPLPLGKGDAPAPPKGHGNVASVDLTEVASFADEAGLYLRSLENYFRVSIRRIGIDAPSDPRPDILKRRLAEEALRLQGIKCFSTPSATEFGTIRMKVQNHMRAGGLESRLPYANKLWMLIGFALFSRLRNEWECLEVYPQATMGILGATSIHKSKEGGVSAQAEAISRHTGWPWPPVLQLPELRTLLKDAVHAPLHDGLDAYSSAWVAALDPASRNAFGSPPNDVIWVPRLSTC